MPNRRSLMNGTPSASAADQAKVQILLKEYDTLHAETASRINNRFAIVGFVLAMVSFVGTRSDLQIAHRWVLGVLGLAMSVVVWWRLGQLIVKCTRRICAIERRVNQLMGEDLLVWGSQVAARTLFYKFHRSSEGAPVIFRE
jgi:hypothetical protein